jgi:pyrimidine-nucleoside phosphorylase
VDNVSLIAASIMSKKIAAGADAIVLDVKVGDGAFLKTIADARELAESMLDLGRHAGREVACMLTDMDQPLGHAVGNALEIRESIATLRGQGPPDFTELVLDASAHLLAFSDLGVDQDAGRELASRATHDGSALAMYERWIAAQGGDPAEDALPAAPVVREVVAPRAGFVTAIGAVDVGLAALRLGAGRLTKEQGIDHAVGVRCLKKRGDGVEIGETIAEVHARDDASAARAADQVAAAYAFGDNAPAATPIVLETIV